MYSHNRLLSILHIVYGAGHILIFVMINMFLNIIMPFIESEISGGEEFFIVQAVMQFGRAVFFILIVLVPLPSLIGGIALLNNKRWGMTLMMISGCLSLLNIPVGTALGVYTIWAYLENQKKKDPQSHDAT